MVALRQVAVEPLAGQLVKVHIDCCQLRPPQTEAADTVMDLWQQAAPWALG